MNSTAENRPRTWIDIDLDALTENYHTACSLTDSLVTCVVKSNAYGHGLLPVSLALQRAGCSSFAVSCAREALALRKGGIQGEILVMGLSEAHLLDRLITAQVSLTVADLQGIKDVEAAAERAKCNALVHLKLDTGFHRLGFSADEATAKEVADALQHCSRISASGLYSHLGLITPERDEMQHERLIAFQKALSGYGLTIQDVHICDSIGLVRYPRWHHSRCRVGAMLYGVRPSRSENMPFACRETLTFCTRVAQVRSVEPGEVIGYDEKGLTDHPMRIATLCAGYGDGYPRCLSGGKGQVLIRGARCSVIGLICMDQMMVDVTHLPQCESGDTAVLLGGGVSYAEYAEWAKTNRNECITILSARPVRRYWQNGQIIEETDALLD